MEEVDIKELLSSIWNKKIEIIIITVVLMIVGVIYSFTMVTPKYQSSTTLVLASLSDASTVETITQTDISINSKLITTYSELVKSKTVLRTVLTNLELQDKISEESLKKNIKVTQVDDTEIIKITVTNEDPEIAAKVANEIAKIFAEKVNEIYGINNVYTVDVAEVSTVPSNINHIKDIAIFTVAGAVVGILEVLVRKLLDNKVRSEHDIEDKMNLLVIGMLPKNEYINNIRREAHE